MPGATDGLLVSVDGGTCDQKIELRALCGLWSNSEWVCIRALWTKLHSAEEEELATFRNSITLRA